MLNLDGNSICYMPRHMDKYMALFADAGSLLRLFYMRHEHDLLAH